jgi:hypothetical protein
MRVMRGTPHGVAALALLTACSGGSLYPVGDAGAGGPFTRDTPPPSRDTPPASQDNPNPGGPNCVIPCDQTYACNVTESLNGLSQSTISVVTFTTVNGQCVTGDNGDTLVQCDGTVIDVTDAGSTVIGRAQATQGGGFQLCVSTNQATVCLACAPAVVTASPPQPGGASADGG